MGKYIIKIVADAAEESYFINGVTIADGNVALTKKDAARMKRKKEESIDLIKKKERTCILLNR